MGLQWFIYDGVKVALGLPRPPRPQCPTASRRSWPRNRAKDSQRTAPSLFTAIWTRQCQQTSSGKTQGTHNNKDDNNNNMYSIRKLSSTDDPIMKHDLVPF